MVTSALRVDFIVILPIVHWLRPALAVLIESNEETSIWLSSDFCEPILSAPISMVAILTIPRSSS